MKIFALSYCILISVFSVHSQIKTKMIDVGKGWANNSINTVIFRNNAITSKGDTQFLSYYDKDGHVILAKRRLSDEKWTLKNTQLTGNIKDAHNAISLVADTKETIHLSWDHHDNKLNYAQLSSDLENKGVTVQNMTGEEEDKVSYPQFFNLKDGNLLFLYRSGQSGKGRLVIKRFNTEESSWEDLHTNLIDGEGERNAYWQACVDKQGTIHLSWVWRESWDVATNHDLGYAKSTDGGSTWQKSTGEKYKLPITVKTAEYAWKIPQESELINQTSMTCDNDGNPFIVNYWTENEKTNYQIVYLEDGNWKHENTNFRNSTFQLGGGGTKKIPISRPEILLKETEEDPMIYLLFRDSERGSKISLAYHRLHDEKPWQIIDLTNQSVGEWEPNYDQELWDNREELHIFVQKVNQVDGEGLANAEPSMIQILEVSNLPVK